MNDELILHPQTATFLQSLTSDLPHAIMLSGPKGVGKSFITRQWLQYPPGQLRFITPEEGKKGIVIEQVRGLYRETRSRQDRDRVFVLEDVDTMTTDAQNAFLKLLEEPNASTHFILLADAPHHLLATIRSRVQEIPIYPIESAQLEDFLARTYPKLSKDATQQILFVSRGRLGLASRLAQDKDLLTEYRELAATAKTFLLGSKLERLKAISTLKDYREKTITILELVNQMARTLLRKAARPKVALEWAEKIGLTEQTITRLIANGNIRAQLTFLALSL